MSGMKISLDAAMRARDVSPSGWRDDDPPDCDQAPGTATSGEPSTGEPTSPVEFEPADSEAAEREASASEASWPAAQPTRGGQVPGADGERRRRRRRLRRGGTH